MKECIITLFILFSTVYANSQNAAIDSINHLLSEAKTDTGRINLGVKKISLLTEVNIDSSMIFGKKIIEESKRINYESGEADALINIAADFSIKGDYISTVQSLKRAEEICILMKDSSRFARLYAGYGMMYGIQSKYDTSILYYEKTIGLAERLGNKKLLGSAYGNLAIGYQMQSNFPQALVYQQKSLKLAEEQNDISAQAYTLMNMGNTYQNIGDTLGSEKALLKGISLAKSIGIKNVELYGYSNLATLYSLVNKWDKSYTFAMNAAELARTMGDAGIQASSISKAAMALAKNKKYSEAESLNKIAMGIADSSDQHFNISQVYGNMGGILKLQEKYKEAIPFLEKSIRMLKEANPYDDGIAQAYFDLSVCYENTGNYIKALTSFKTSKEIEDSINSKENVRKATVLSMNYEFEKKQTIADAIQGKKNAEVRLKQLLLLSGLGLTLIIAAGAWVAFRNKQKANAILQQQKTEIEDTLAKLKLTQAQLIQSEKMASLGELTAGIAHEIQNPLNFVNNFSEVNNELIEEMNEEMKKGNKEEARTIANDIKENNAKITHHGRRADAIVKGMLQHSRSSSGIKEPTDINKLADEYLRLAYHGMRAKDKEFNAEMEIDFDAGVGEINVISPDIGRVLLNLFNNAFYTVTEKKKQLPENYKPTVSVSTKKINDRIEIRVKDNGNGIAQNMADKIFQPFFTTKPTGEGTGLGLSLSYDIIKAHGGEIKLESKEGEGSAFVIYV